MKFFFSIITSVFLFLGITPIALAANGPALNADRASTEYTASALTKCSENPKFIERANSATTQKDIARFERYGKASCGDDGLPHLIIGPPLEPWGALLNDEFPKMVLNVKCKVILQLWSQLVNNQLIQELQSMQYNLLPQF